MEWRKAWRDGIAKALTTNGLESLGEALYFDRPELIQGATTSPPPLPAMQNWPCTAGCAIGFAGWMGDGIVTVGDVESHFADVCYKADQLLGGPTECRWFLNWFDDTPRDVMRKELLAEVVRELDIRKGLIA